MNERAYYNEIDAPAVAVLRELILRNVIPAGDVDTRSIKEVTLNDLSGYTQCHFFAGGGSGPSQGDLPDGPTLAHGGRVRVRAKAKASRARDSEPMIQGISGRTFIASSVPPGPLSSWENRLRQRLARIGSTESALIWKLKTTPQGRSISRLVPSMLHTNGTDFIGQRWTTVSARDWKDSAGMSLQPRKDGASRVDLLPRQMLSYNRSPTAGEKRGGSYADPAKAAARMNSGHTINLEDQMVVAAYSPTPTSLSFKDSHQPGNSRSLNLMRAHFETALGGPTPNGSSAPSTAKRGAPNPAFPFWLMGFPDEWICGALAAMRSHRSSRRKSSPRSSKAKMISRETADGRADG